MIGLGIILNENAEANQSVFDLNAVAGTLTVVSLDGIIQNPNTYEINLSKLIFDTPLQAGVWVHVISGLGGTFIPQSYVDDSLEDKVSGQELSNALGNKINKSGGSFTGEVNVQTPQNNNNPVTLEMWESLPDNVMGQADVASLIQGKTDKSYVDDALDALKEEILSLTIQLEDDKIDIANIPNSVFYDDVTFAKFGTLVVSAAKGRWYPTDFGNFRKFIAYVETAPVGSDIRINIKKNGSTVFTGGNRLVIPAGQNSGTYEFTDPMPVFNQGDYVEMSIEQVGSSTAGSNLTAQLNYQYRPEE